MRRKSGLKRILLALVALILVAAIGAGIFLSGRQQKDPVNVFSFQYIGMTEYWGDSQESSGQVQSDKVQTVFLSDTQSVTEILVCAGDYVKKGDVLMTFDTTLSDLALERKRLEVEKLKLQLEDAKDELARIRRMKPMVIPTPSDEPEEDANLGVALTEPYKLSSQSKYDGSSKEKALICWLNSGTAISDELFRAIIRQAEVFQTNNARKEDPSSSSGSSTEAPTEAPVEVPTEAPAETPVEVPTEAPTETPTEAPSDAPTEAPSEAPTVAPSDAPTEAPSDAPTEAPSDAPTEAPSDAPTEAPSDAPTEAPSDDSEDPTEPEPVKVDHCYVVFKVTSGNMSLGNRTVWQGMLISRSGDSFSFKFYDASTLSDHMLSAAEQTPQTPQIDFGSGFTASQIAEMRSQQEKTIKDLEFDIKMAEAEYKIMQTEVSDGKVYADVDGTVVSLLTEEEAQMTGQPLLKISGGGGFYVEGFISELDRDSVALGSEVTVNDWRTGMMYTGTVESIGDYPNSYGYWNGMGNPTATYYPFTVFVADDADLQTGSYVSITYSAGSTENGIYLENPFVRTESGKSYVYVRGEDGNLEQRFVTTGKSLWGSYTEILEGLTAEDFLAFPYGTDVKPGAPTVEAEIRALYE